MTTLVDVDERLMAEFEGRVGLHVVTRTVQQCRHALSGPHGEPSPEDVEVLARRVLQDLAREPRPAR
jgi:hypothetical protein